MEEEMRTGQVVLPQDMMLPRPVILPNSTRGDMVHQVCLVVLEWMIETGDELVVSKARKIKRNWEKEQQWVVEWGNTSGFFQILANAKANPEGYKEMRKIAPNEGVDTVLMLVDRTLARLNGEQPQRKKPPKVIELSRYKKQSGNK